MRYAVILRGRHYWGNDRAIPNYKECYKTLFDNIINPLKNSGHIVDIICLTYNSSIIRELVQYYSPSYIAILSADNDNNDPVESRLRVWHLISVKRIREIEKEKNIAYDIVLSLRYDIFIKKSITDLNINYSKFNVLFPHTSGNCDADFWLFNISWLDDFEQAMTSMHKNGAILHEINRYMPHNSVHYIVPTMLNLEENKNEYAYFNRRIK